MELLVNGEKREIPSGLTVAGLLDFLAVPSERVAVEVNHAVVRRVDHDSHVLAEGDEVEVVAFVGGG